MDDDITVSQVRASIESCIQAFPDTQFLACIGGADTKDEAFRAHTAIDAIFGSVAAVYASDATAPPYCDCAIVSGGTNSGIPAIATERAIAHQLPIVGVIPERGREDLAAGLATARGPRRHVIVVPPWHRESAWGDESPVLVGLANYLLVLGGGWGTMVEVALALKYNASILRRIAKRMSHPSYLKHLLPLAEFPGSAQQALAAPWLTDELKEASFPFGELGSPEAAARAILKLLEEDSRRSG